MLAMAGGLAFVAGCNDDDPAGPHEHAEAHEVRLTIGAGAGAQVVTISENGTIGGGPITIAIGAVAISAEIIDEDDDVINGELDPADFEIDFATGNAATVTVTETGQFSGTLTGVAAGNTTIATALNHEGHADFGPFNVPVTVTP
jgi:hypothetical protein